MPKDYTDFVLMIFGSGERVVEYVHLSNYDRKGHHWWKKKKDNKLNGKPYGPTNGHSYVLNLDRAYRIKWTPWQWWEPGNPIKSLYELLRSKKIGLLLYQEPPPPREVKIVSDCECSCGFKSKTMKGTKIHTATAGGDPANHVLIEKYSTELVGVAKAPIEPIHISRIHQPSGVIKG